MRRVRVGVRVRHLGVDHIIPHSRGGGDHIENLQLLCAHCNRVKGYRTQEYLIAQLRGTEDCGMTATQDGDSLPLK